MRLTELHRTTGFRLATLFLMLFGVIAILLFGYLYREITGFEQVTKPYLLRYAGAKAFNSSSKYPLVPLLARS